MLNVRHRIPEYLLPELSSIIKAIFDVPSYEKGLEKVMVVHLLAGKVTLPLNTASASVTGIQSEEFSNATLSVLTKYMVNSRYLDAPVLKNDTLDISQASPPNSSAV